MQLPNKILVFQTAFLGDVVLTLPLVQVLHREFPHAQVDFVATPKASSVLRNHPAIHSIIEYDKRGSQRGLRGMMAIAGVLKAGRYDVALVPHRSLRSGIVVAMSGIPRRICFETAAGRILFNETVPYDKTIHEIERNLSFLKTLHIDPPKKELPVLYPSKEDADLVGQWFTKMKVQSKRTVIAIAPGSVWNTKRWPRERFSTLAKKIVAEGGNVVLVGGKEDEELCRQISVEAGGEGVSVSAGSFSILQSAEIIRRCTALVSNDSAPMHLAVSMGTPVIALFGATVPSFGFAPYGRKDVVVQTEGLSCRPCSIHGGDRCPIGTFDCMMNISPEFVFEKLARWIS